MGFSDIQLFNLAINRHRKLRKLGLLLCSLIRIAGITASIIACYGLLDYFMAFHSKTRLVMDVILGFGLFGIFVSWLLDLTKLSQRQMAAHLDRASGNPRRDILCACELASRHKKEQSKLESYLTGQVIKQGITELKNISYRLSFPFSELRRRLRTTLIQTAITLAILSLNPTAAKTIFSRIITPLRDIPPYSTYTFKISPQHPSVIYGGNLDISAKISGAPSTSQVWCQLRSNGKLNRLACFKNGASNYTQRLEQITDPLDFCFVIGKARSHWQHITINYQPEIAAIIITITPPPYSMLPARQFPAGSEPLTVLPGSRISLQVTSNRDLKQGNLTITPPRHPDQTKLVSGNRTPQGDITFNWVATRNATVSIRIFDHTGTANRKPFTIRQSLITDLPPTVTITQPPAYSLATPESIVPIRGEASDDLGLRYAGITRSLVGYRDRFTEIPAVFSRKTFDINYSLNLAEIGVNPGDVLEFYAEAGDRNPALTGVAASDLIRIKIISNDEYIAILRERTTIEAFSARFNLAQQNMQNLQQAIKDLQQELKKSPNNSAKIAQKLKKLQQQQKQTLDTFRRISNDFAVYDIENSLKQQLKQITTNISKHSQWLNNATAESPDLAAKLNQMADDVNVQANELQQTTDAATEIAALAKLMQQAMTFQQLLREQESLTRRLARYRNKKFSERKALLAALNLRQKEIREQLIQFAATITKLAGELPPQHRKLADDTTDFAKRIFSDQIPQTMANAENACRNQNGLTAWQFADQALKKLKALLSNQQQNGKNCKNGTNCKNGKKGTKGKKGRNSFCDMCNGNLCSSGGNNGSCISQTLQEMLDAFLKKGCQKSGNNPALGRSGSGLGGTAGGYWRQGQSQLNTPVYGPQRSQYTRYMRGSGKGGHGNASCNTASFIKPQNQEHAKPTSRKRADSKSMLIEEVPEKYRQAIKEYFSQ